MILLNLETSYSRELSLVVLRAIIYQYTQSFSLWLVVSRELSLSAYLILKQLEGWIDPRTLHLLRRAAIQNFSDTETIRLLLAVSSSITGMLSIGNLLIHHFIFGLFASRPLNRKRVRVLKQ
jgi:hypothetical protein